MVGWGALSRVHTSVMTSGPTWPEPFYHCYFSIQKQVKINAGKIERRFGVVMTPFSSSKMIQINCQE